MEHCLEIRDGLIIRPQYTLQHWMHALRIPLGQLRVGSHRLRVETDHHIDRADRICQLCHLREIETETHFIFGCPAYYEIRDRFHCLFRSSQNLTSFLRYVDQICLALYLQEAFRFRACFLQPPTRSDTIEKIIDFFRVLPSAQGTKRTIDRPTDTETRSMRSWGTTHQNAPTLQDWIHPWEAP